MRLSSSTKLSSHSKGAGSARYLRSTALPHGASSCWVARVRKTGKVNSHIYIYMYLCTCMYIYIYIYNYICVCVSNGTSISCLSFWGSLQIWRHLTSYPSQWHPMETGDLSPCRRQNLLQQFSSLQVFKTLVHCPHVMSEAEVAQYCKQKKEVQYVRHSVRQNQHTTWKRANQPATLSWNALPFIPVPSAITIPWRNLQCGACCCSGCIPPIFRSSTMKRWKWTCRNLGFPIFHGISMGFPRLCSNELRWISAKITKSLGFLYVLLRVGRLAPWELPSTDAH